MHRISDKELDKLFQQRFMDAEFQPSGDVWDKINAKMEQKQKVKRTFPVFWMAAASVIVVIGAGLWIYRPVEVIKLQGAKHEMVENVPASPISDLGTGAALLDPHQPEIKGVDFSKLVVSEEKSVTPEEVVVPEKSAGELPRQDLISSNITTRKNNPVVVQPKKEVRISRYTGDQSQLDVTQPDMIASAEVKNEVLIPEHEQPSPKRIKSVGSLVNFVISKVDRRDDKIIEFKDGEEGSQVSGINLGLIKLKSRKR